MKPNTFSLNSQLKIDDVINIAVNNYQVDSTKEVDNKIADNWSAIEQMLKRGDIMYGLNTGIGGLGNVKLSADKAGRLSTLMLRAHASGCGKPVEEQIAKATLFLRTYLFTKGYSGVRPGLFKTFIEMLNKKVIPVFYCRGSVGTSGDLAPLSQMGLVAIGEGQAYWQGKIFSGKLAMKKAGIPTIKLSYREGLAIMNGTQYMSAVACFNIWRMKKLLKIIQIVSAMTIEVLNCVESAYSRLYNQAKLYPGQPQVAENIRNLISGSQLLTSDKLNTQNAYSLRSVPQVVGIAVDMVNYIADITEKEINSVADNPLFFTKEKICLTGANFHGAPIGYSQDLLKIIATDLGNLSERQTNNLLDPACSKILPAFLVKNPGLNSGLMISQYTQAALIAENKVLSGSVSVDSIPVSANQEDHVSFATIAARQASEIISNLEIIVAIQLLCVCQACEFRRPGRPSKSFKAVYDLVRSISPAINEDRAFYRDIEKITPLVREFKVLEVVEQKIGRLKGGEKQ